MIGNPAPANPASRFGKKLAALVKQRGKRRLDHPMGYQTVYRGDILDTVPRPKENFLTRFAAKQELARKLEAKRAAGRARYLRRMKHMVGHQLPRGDAAR